MTPNTIKSIVFIFLLLNFSACSTKKATLKDIYELPKVQEEILISHLDSLHRQQPDFFTARFNTKFQDNNGSQSFRTSVKMKVDSAFQAIITFAKIPIINTLITTDSVTLVDRRNQCFVQNELNYFSELFNIDFSLKNFQELLMGLPLDWNLEKEYYQIKETDNYIISSSNKHSAKNQERDFSIRYYLTNDTQLLHKVAIESPENNTTIEIDYSEHEEIDGYMFPQLINVQIKTDKNNIFVELKHTKVTINEPSVIYLSIPDKYEECE